MKYRHNAFFVVMTLAGTLVGGAPLFAAVAAQTTITAKPPNAGVQPMAPSVHLACSYRKIGSGWYAARYGIYARNTTRGPIPANAKIKWKVHIVHGSSSKTVVGEQSPNQTKTGEFVIKSRQGLQVGAEIKVAEETEVLTNTDTWKISGCDAEI